MLAPPASASSTLPPPAARSCRCFELDLWHPCGHTYIHTYVQVFVFIFAGTHTLTTTVCCCCLCGNLCFKLFTARLRLSVCPQFLRPIAAAALLDLTAKMRCGAVIKHDFLLYWFYSMLPTIVIMVFYSIYIQIIMTQCIFYFSPCKWRRLFCTLHFANK